MFSTSFPPPATILFSVLFAENAPESFGLEGFASAVDHDPLQFQTSPVKLNVGYVTTRHHAMKVAVRTGLDRVGSNKLPADEEDFDDSQPFESVEDEPTPTSGAEEDEDEDEEQQQECADEDTEMFNDQQEQHPVDTFAFDDEDGKSGAIAPPNPRASSAALKATNSITKAAASKRRIKPISRPKGANPITTHTTPSTPTAPEVRKKRLSLKS